MKIDVYNVENSKVGSVELADDVFGAEVKESLLWEQVKAQLASRRRGTHSTKTRGDVSGGGAKPFRQKGTGRARQGSSRSPNMVGGGVAFGPHPRDYSYRLPRSARRAALKSALSLRVKEGNLMILDTFKLDAPKTKDVASFVERVGAKSVLFVDGGNVNLQRSSRNLPKSKYVEAGGINVRDILNHEKLVLTQAVIEMVVAKAMGKIGADDNGDTVS